MQYDDNGALLSSVIPELPEPRRGKVRDTYGLGDSLLLVASDRISAFDVVKRTGDLYLQAYRELTGSDL